MLRPRGFRWSHTLPSNFMRCHKSPAASTPRVWMLAGSPRRSRGFHRFLRPPSARPGVADESASGIPSVGSPAIRFGRFPNMTASACEAPARRRSSSSTLLPKAPVKWSWGRLGSRVPPVDRGKARSIGSRSSIPPVGRSMTCRTMGCRAGTGMDAPSPRRP